MKRYLCSAAVAMALIAASVVYIQAQRGPAPRQMRGDGPPPDAAPFSITRSDPALDAIIAPDAKLVELARGFGLTEGGLWIAEGNSGYWIFAGLLDNVLYKVTPQQAGLRVHGEGRIHRHRCGAHAVPRLAPVAVMCCSLVPPAPAWTVRGG